MPQQNLFDFARQQLHQGYNGSKGKNRKSVYTLNASEHAPGVDTNHLSAAIAYFV